jgi:fermentation-respiration switch protein FrsA (DUF1100 family)
MLTNRPSFAPHGVKKPTTVGRGWRRLVATLLTLAVVLIGSYTAISIYIGTQIQVATQTPASTTPATLGLQYKNVTFPSREDHLQIRGWFIPGVLPNGHLTAQRTIIMVHGDQNNRADKYHGLLNLSGDLARRGFAVLAYDIRGNGESPPSARSFGLYEQRDALGAVDFLRSGPLPYPDLGRSRAIAGWGESLGAAIIILAAANEPAIKAIVSDSAYADILPRLERDIAAKGHLPPLFTPGGLIAAQVIYGVDYYNTRPVDVIASIAPRPIFLIQGANDNQDHASTPPSNMYTLAAAARNAPNANVQTWLVPGATHAQSYNVEGKVYVDRLVAFYTAALGPDTSES